MKITLFFNELMKKVICLILVLVTSNCFAQQYDYLEGYVTETETSDALPGATVYILEFPDFGTIADLDGHYKLAIPDSLSYFTVVFRFIGLKDKYFIVDRRKDLIIQER